MVVVEFPSPPASVEPMVGALDDNSTRAKDPTLAVECDDSASGITYQLEQSFQLIRKIIPLHRFIDEYDVVIDQAAEPEAARRASEPAVGVVRTVSVIAVVKKVINHVGPALFTLKSPQCRRSATI
jgi:hypothetical protein